MLQDFFSCQKQKMKLAFPATGGFQRCAAELPGNLGAGLVWHIDETLDIFTSKIYP